MTDAMQAGNAKILAPRLQYAAGVRRSGTFRSRSRIPI
ncbi:hypothetical protein ABIC65_001597 [Sphingomonas trueperi]